MLYKPTCFKEVVIFASQVFSGHTEMMLQAKYQFQSYLEQQNGNTNE